MSRGICWQAVIENALCRAMSSLQMNRFFGENMDCKIIDGKTLAADIRREVSEKVAALKQKGIEPCLAVILVGENPARSEEHTSELQSR